MSNKQIGTYQNFDQRPSAIVVPGDDMLWGATEWGWVEGVVGIEGEMGGERFL